MLYVVVAKNVLPISADCINVKLLKDIIPCLRCYVYSCFDDVTEQEWDFVLVLIPGLGKPEEIASAIVFLLSDDAAFITGVQLPVDSGWLVS